jgi:hypothetical protein
MFTELVSKVIKKGPKNDVERSEIYRIGSKIHMHPTMPNFL